MTTPNIEELRLLAQTLEFSDAVRCSIQRAADLLQSQAERISGLEKEVAFQIKMKEQHCKRLSDERDTLRAQLAAIAATAPVAEVGGTFTLYWVGSGPIEPIVKKYGIKVGDKLFTHPMPAQDVTELVDALENYANPANWQEDFKGVQRTWLEPDSDTRNVYSGFELARDALSKYKGVKG